MASLVGTVKVNLDINLSLWSAIKLRISGLYTKPYKTSVTEIAQNRHRGEHA